MRVFLISCLACGIFVLDLLTPLGWADGFLYVIPLLLLFPWGQASYAVPFAAACTALTVLGYLYSPAGAPRDMAFVNRVTGLLVFWAMTYLLIRSNQATEVLQASEEQYRSLVQNARDVIFSLSPEGRITELNPVFETITGWKRSEWIGKSFASLLHPDDVPFSLELLQQTLSEDLPGTFALRVRSKSGAYFVGEFSIARATRRGKVVGVLGVARDITERKRAEDALRQSERRMRAILDGALDAVVGMDVQGIITDWNLRAEAIFGWTRGEAVGRKMSDMIIPPQYREAHACGLRHFLATGSGPFLNRRIELAALHHDGREFPIELAVLPLKDGDSYRFTAFIADITERKRAEQALREREQQLHQLLDDRERLSQDLHDNIIQTIYAIGLKLEECRQLVGEGSTESARSGLEDVLVRLNGVICDVRRHIDGQISQISSGRQLKAALWRLARTMEFPHALRFGVAVDEVAADKLTPEETNQLLSIAREAMSNSLRHSKARTALVSLRVRDGGVRFQVEDDGVGFDANADADRGLGLRNIEARARKLGGRFEVVSERGYGVRIVLDIPKEKKHASA